MCIRDRTYTKLLSTSDSAVLKKDWKNITTSKAEDSDENGPFTTGPVSYTHLDVYKRQLEAPLYYIAANAGLEGAVIINKVKESAPGTGFNAATEEYVDMVERCV